MSVNYLALGASIYTPMTHHQAFNLLVSNTDYVRSRIFCLEDAILDHQVKDALTTLRRALPCMPSTSQHYRFVRVRNVSMLREVLMMPSIEKLEGIVLPKFDTATMQDYIDALSACPSMTVMPTIETRDAYDTEALKAIREAIQAMPNPVPCVRIGGNDLLSLLGIKRQKGMTIYETPVGQVIQNAIIQFRLHGYEISSPVMDIIDDLETLKREVSQDVALGIYAKTAIHPDQIGVIEQFYRVKPQDFQMAKQIVSESDRAVFKMNDQMCELTCHSNWAVRTLSRDQYYRDRSNADHKHSVVVTFNRSSCSR